MGLGDEQTGYFQAEVLKCNARLGETVTVRVTSDNSNCSKAIEPVAIKVSMRAMFSGTNQQDLTNEQDLIEMRRNVLKVTGKGVKAGEILT